MIDLDGKSLIIGDDFEFSYDISIPNGLDYNEYSYATFTAYYALVTNEGLFRTQKTSTKIGLHVSENYNLIIDKFQENSPKFVPEAIYSVSEVKNVNGTEILSDSKVSYTNYLGEATFNNLYVEKVYEIKEITFSIKLFPPVLVIGRRICTGIAISRHCPISRATPLCSAWCSSVSWGFVP